MACSSLGWPGLEFCETPAAAEPGLPFGPAPATPVCCALTLERASNANIAAAIRRGTRFVILRSISKRLQGIRVAHLREHALQTVEVLLEPHFRVELVAMMNDADRSAVAAVAYGLHHLLFVLPRAD